MHNAHLCLIAKLLAVHGLIFTGSHDLDNIIINVIRQFIGDDNNIQRILNVNIM